jgi:hypothetical protein
MAQPTHGISEKQISQSLLDMIENQASSLQTGYELTPAIVTNPTNGAVEIKVGSGADSDKVLIIENTAGAEVASVTGEGRINAVNYNGYIPENTADKVSVIQPSATEYPNNNAVIQYVEDKKVDTLQSVTDRGHTTTNSVVISNTIPDGTVFEGPAGSTNDMCIQLAVGSSIGSGPGYINTRMLNFFDFPASNRYPKSVAWFGIEDRNDQARFRMIAETAGYTNFGVLNKSQQHVLNFYEDGLDNVEMGLPKTNSRIIIGDEPWYLRPYKLVVRGDAIVEGKSIINGSLGVGIDIPTAKLHSIGTVRHENLTNAQGDSTFTKQVVAKPDGTFGVEDKVSNRQVLYVTGRVDQTDTNAPVVTINSQDVNDAALTFTTQYISQGWYLISVASTLVNLSNYKIEAFIQDKAFGPLAEAITDDTKFEFQGSTMVLYSLRSGALTNGITANQFSIHLYKK